MQNQKLEQNQRLKISSKQIQFLSLLQTPSMDLERVIEKELEENPALEEAEENESENDQNNYAHRRENKFQPEKQLVEKSITLSEFLESQMIEVSLDSKSEFLVKYLINSLDKNGFITRDLHIISSDLFVNYKLEVDEDELLDCLKIIQKFDPIGVGARSLKESLLIQLKNKKRTLETELALYVISNFYSEFMNKNYEKLLEKTNKNKEEIRSVYKEVEKLNPFPGSEYSGEKKEEKYIVPDFNISIIDNRPVASLLRCYKKIKTSAYYQKMLKTAKDNSVVEFLKRKIDAAKWFQNALKEREKTLLDIMQVIVNFQEKYFLSGNEVDLKPMKLIDIAKIVKMDISTISRMSNSKYFESFFGCFLVKDLFSEAYMQLDGTSVSIKVIKKRLQEIIKEEDKTRPLSDEKIAEVLGGEDYLIARRTVAKYRASLSIPTKKMRRVV